jgi:WD40 repeat protein
VWERRRVAAGLCAAALVPCLTLVVLFGGPKLVTVAATAAAAGLGIAALAFFVVEWGVRDRGPKPGELHGVPPLPREYVQRDELPGLRELLLAENEEAVAIGPSIGLQGEGGIGKTVLAVALAHDEELRRNFPDGVFWVTVGEQGNLFALQVALLALLGASASGLRSIDACAVALQNSLFSRRALLIIDDVWSTTAAHAFRVVGPKGRLLYTTRNVRAVEAVGATVQRADLLSDRAARALLVRFTGERIEGMSPAVDRILASTGGVALALALVGAAVGRGGRTWEEAADKLEREAETFLNHPYANVFKAMEFAVTALDDELQAAYRALAVYPEDTSVPVVAVARLWTWMRSNRVRVGLVATKRTQSRLRRLAKRELLVIEGTAFMFHDLQRSFLLLRAGDTELLHVNLLAAYKKLLPQRASGWSDLPFREPYIWDRLFAHLRGAGDAAAMHAVATDLAYLAVRCFRDGPYATESDLRIAEAEDEGAPAIEWAIDLFTRWSHLLADRATLTDVVTTIAARAKNPPPPLDVCALEALTSAPLLVPRWGLPDAPQALRRVLKSDVRGIEVVAFAPDGQALATSGRSGTVWLWNLVTGGRSLLTGHQSGVSKAVFAPDGRTLATAHHDGTVRLWEVPAGKARGIPFLHHHEENAEFVDNRMARSRTVAERVVAMQFAPDGRTLATVTTHGVLRLSDVSTDDGRQIIEHTGKVKLAAFSPDAGTLASGGEDGIVHIWDTITGGQRGKADGHQGAVRALSFALDGRTLASAGCDETVRLWDPATGELRAVVEGGARADDESAFAGKPRPLVATDGAGELVLHDAVTGASVMKLRHDRGGINAIVMSPDGSALASAGDDGTVRLWNAATGEELAKLKGHREAVRVLAFAPDGQTLASGGADGTVRLWDAAIAKTSPSLESESASASASVRRVTFSSNGDALVSSDADGKITLWDPATGQQRAVPEHICYTGPLAIAGGGGVLATGHRDGTIRVWDTDTGSERLMLEGHRGEILAVAFSPDGRTLASAGDDATVRLWEASAGRECALFGGHGGRVATIVFSPDGGTLASAGDEGNVRLWDLTTGTQVFVLEGVRPVWTLAFAADARMLASAVADDSVRLWPRRGRGWARPASGIAWRRRWTTNVIVEHRSLTGIAFVPNAGALVTVASQQEWGMIRMWDPKTRWGLRTRSAIANINVGSYINALASSSGLLVLAAESGVIALEPVANRREPYDEYRPRSRVDLALPRPFRLHRSLSARRRPTNSALS